MSNEEMAVQDKVTEAYAKIKVTKADIVVHGTKEKPYFVIVYREVGKDYDYEGFGSYKLDFVFAWREQYFEIVQEEVQNAKTMSNLGQHSFIFRLFGMRGKNLSL